MLCGPMLWPTVPSLPPAKVIRSPQLHENSRISYIIIKLDKHTLKLYTPLRTELGTRELSRIRLAFKEMQANGIGTKFQEEWLQ
jgi:hypothetical protein